MGHCYKHRHISESACPGCKIDRLKRELEEARADVERWRKFFPNHAAAYEQGKAEARQQAAREIIEWTLTDNSLPQYANQSVREFVEAKFGFKWVKEIENDKQ